MRRLLMAEPELLLTHYAIHDRIASGGMGSIHLARVVGSVGFARTVVVKRLRRIYADDPDFVSSFVDEARLVARIRHPNVVAPLDVVAERGELFLVLEYVHGEVASRLLKTMIARNERIPTPVAISIGVGALLGLHAAHDAKDERGAPLRIVHRDVSPHNVIVGADGHARVIDFGIAKAVGRLRSTRRGSDQIKGKLAYMAPEQVLGDPVDHRADVYAASIVLWELLCGRRLSDAPGVDGLVERVAGAPVDPPSKHNRELSRQLDDIVLRGLQRDPNARWPTARAMAFAIEQATTPATASQVGAWVTRLASTSLAELAAKIAAIESDAMNDRLSSVLEEIRATRED
ncbi:MAG TPA: serine/threonine-protein kinase [Polyangiaceae bacterium]